jgi:hypothetical protein
MAEVRTEMRADIEQLVQRYQQHRDDYIRTSSTYNEADTRADFIDALFAALGWDINNVRGLSHRFREVVRETRVDVDANTKRPDYAFRLGPERRFFVEAKRPSVSLPYDPEPAFQVRRYGWSAGLMVSVVTNFETLVIYDTTTLPLPGHPAHHSRLRMFSFDQYVDSLDEIAALLSRTAVYSGAFDERFSQQVQSNPAEKMDTVFLRTLNAWRLDLAEDLVNYDAGVSQQALNEIVQSLILRVLFLRICEDRGIQTYEKLKTVTEALDWSAFVEMLQQSDHRFDSELFSTRRHSLSDGEAAGLRLDAATIHHVVEDLYYPRAPFTFSVIEPAFLGEIYEHFLLEHVAKREEGLALEPKPENENRDVVHTPRPLIDRVVRETIEDLVSGYSPEELLHLRVLDPACGSGGFLMAAFDTLVEAAIKAHSADGDTSAVYEVAGGHHLSFHNKRSLLTRCLFGVDRDYFAAEVTRFGLLVKLLETESASTLPDETGLLPALSENILCGDSLVDDRLFDSQDDTRTIGPPLTWGQDIDCPFTVVVGNPPYLSTESMVNLEPTEYDFYKSQYRTAYRQFDKYYLFIERALDRLLDQDGVCGLVVSRKFTHIESGRKLRGLISRGRHLTGIVDFGSGQLFDGRTTYACLLFLRMAGVPVPDDPADDVIQYELVTTPREWLSGLVSDSGPTMSLPREFVSGEEAWLLPSTQKELELILQLRRDTAQLGDLLDVFNGVQTSAESVYEIKEWDDVDDNLISFESAGETWKIEREILRPFFNDKLADLRSFYPMPDTARLIFPYSVEETAEGGLQASVVPPQAMRDRFPHAYAWLEHNRDRLEARDISPEPYPEDEWYRYGRSQALTAFHARPKIVVGVNSLGDKYVYDERDTLLASGGTAGECAIATFRQEDRQTSYELHFILALLNHRAIEYYCRKRGSPFRGGWYARGTAVLKTVPVPRIDFDDSEDRRTQHYHRIVDQCRNLCTLYQQLLTADAELDKISLQRNAAALKRQMDDRISELYGVSSLIDDIELPT